MPRECGTCKVCCTAAEVEELNKPSGARCSKLCAGGCSIYAIRPKACAAFQCCYLDGQLPDDEKFRPDNFGCMLETMWLDKADGTRLYMLIGLAETRADLPHVQELAKRFNSPNTIVVIVLKDTRESLVIGTDEDADYYRQWMDYVASKGEVTARFNDGIERTHKVGR